MGILGLTTFVSKNNYLLDKYSLHDCPLVIDGNSLAVQLYLNISKCSSAFGGNYKEYAVSITKFFNSLTKCNITPYVIFDGGYEDKKMKTVLKRLRCRIVDASQLNPTNQSSYLIFPLLMKDVFLETLESLAVKFTVCEYEADHEIASVSRYLKCPVLSYDSDFFIFNVLYIPFPTLNLKPVASRRGENMEYSLTCKLYQVDKFLNKFELKDDMLPLLATLLGNDYIKRSVFSKFYHNIRLPKSKNRTQGQCRISGLISWLKNETTESARQSIMERFKIGQRPRIEKMIEASCANYTKTFCNSLSPLGILESDTPVSEIETETMDYSAMDNAECDPEEPDSDGTDETSSNSSSPEIPYLENLKIDPHTSCWLEALLKTGKVSARFYDLLHKSLYIGSPQVEDVTLPDSQFIAMPILRFSFDIMTGFTKKKMYYEGRKRTTNRTSIIESEIELPNDVFNKWTDKTKTPPRDFFFYFLEKTINRQEIDDVLKLPESLQLIVLTIVWFKKIKGDDKPLFSEEYIFSIILCFIMLNTVMEKIGNEYTYFYINSKYATSLQEWSDQSKSYSKETHQDIRDVNDIEIREEDCMVAASKLLKYFEADQKLLTTPKIFKRQNVHVLSQFQCCFQQMLYLNALTSSPFKTWFVSNMFNGIFLYQMSENLRRRDNPGSYLFQLLEYAPSFLNYFIIIVKFLGYTSCISPNDVIKPSRRKSNKKKNKLTTVSDDMEDSENNLSMKIESDNDSVDENNKFFALQSLSDINS